MGDEEAAEAPVALGLKEVRRRGPWIECGGEATVYAAAGSREERGWQITIRDGLLKRLLAGEPNLHVMLQRTGACVLRRRFWGR